MIPTYVRTQKIINAPASEVWSVIRDFNSFPDWHPYVEASEILELTGSSVGAVRKFTQINGNQITERLMALDDLDYIIKYKVLDGPLPVENYLSTIKVVPLPDGGKCVMKWDVEYDCEPEGIAQLNQDLENVFILGFDRLNEMLG